MAKKNLGGRPAVFTGKKRHGKAMRGTMIISALITPEAAKRFRARREELLALYELCRGQALTSISDADVVEYLIRGRDETITYLNCGAATVTSG